MLHAACRQARQWQKDGLPSLPIAVNMSGLDFDDPALPRRVRAALESSGLNARYLEIELTEQSLMKDAKATVDRLEAIKAIGTTIAVDDFGTGYSSLSYLSRFPIDRLKIDQSFVGNLNNPDELKNPVIVRGIIGLARQLGMEVVAEGVETADQASFLSAEQCHHLQGYLFGKPATPEGFMARVLAEHARQLAARQV